MSSSTPAVPKLPVRQRKRKYSFKQLPGGASGSSINPQTIARNARQRELPPLKAALKRIKDNRRTRIHNQTKALSERPSWGNLTEEAKAAAKEEVKVQSEARYQEDKIKVLRQYEEEIQNNSPPTPADTTANTATAAADPAATTAPTQRPTSHSDDSEFEGINFKASDEESDDWYEVSEEGEDDGGDSGREEEEEEGESGASDSGSDLGEHTNSLRDTAFQLHDVLNWQYNVVEESAK